MNHRTDNQGWDLVIEAGRTERHYWRDLWKYRELFGFLAWRDVLVQYKQTVFGVAWSIVQPLLTMVVFSVVFGRVAKMPSGGYPYPILVYCAMMPWQFFSNSFGHVANSLVGNAGLISKVYFPRLIIPVSKAMVSFVDFVISFAIYLLLMAIYHVPVTPRMLLVPFFLALAFLAAVGLGLSVAALNVRYRDFRFVVPFMMQFGLYVSPVGFSSGVVPAQWRLAYSLNPMVGVIDGFRWALLGGNTPMPAQALAMAVVVIVVATGASVAYFRKTEKAFADII